MTAKCSLPSCLAVAEHVYPDSSAPGCRMYLCAQHDSELQTAMGSVSKPPNNVSPYGVDAYVQWLEGEVSALRAKLEDAAEEIKRLKGGLS